MKCGAIRRFEPRGMTSLGMGPAEIVKHKQVLTIVVVVAIMVSLAILVCSMRVDPGFATRAHLRFHYADKSVDTIITDPKDLEALKRILTGWGGWGGGCMACGRDSDVSLTLSDGIRSITYYPARDTCDSFLVGRSKCLDVGRKKRAEFEAIVRKYGMTFPCI